MLSAQEQEAENDFEIVEVFFWSRDGRMWRWEHWVAAASYVAAALAFLVGALLSAATSLGLIEDAAGRTHQVGTVLIMSFMPLLLLGAACLDRLETTLQGEGSTERPVTPKAEVARRGVAPRATQPTHQLLRHHR